MKFLLLSLLSVCLLTQIACENNSVSPAPSRTSKHPHKKPKTSRVKKDSPTDTTPVTPAVEKTTSFSGRIIATNAYCGGAYPNDEMLEELKQASPYGNKSLRLIPSDKGKIVSFTTDRNGKFNVNILPGNYRLCPGPRPALSVSGYNPNCALWLEHVFAELTIPQKQSYAHNLQIEIPCDPCEPGMKTRP